MHFPPEPKGAFQLIVIDEDLFLTLRYFQPHTLSYNVKMRTYLQCDSVIWNHFIFGFFACLVCSWFATKLFPCNQKEVAIIWNIAAKNFSFTVLGKTNILLQPIIYKRWPEDLTKCINKGVDYIHWEPYFYEFVSKLPHASTVISDLSPNPSLKHRRTLDLAAEPVFFQLSLHFFVTCQNVLQTVIVKTCSTVLRYTSCMAIHSCEGLSA